MPLRKVYKKSHRANFWSGTATFTNLSSLHVKYISILPDTHTDLHMNLADRSFTVSLHSIACGFFLFRLAPGYTCPP